MAARPGQWIGAGGSMIMEPEEHTGTVMKQQYIGIVTMLDILAHIAGDGGERLQLDRKMAVPVTAVIGHCLEVLSLWTLNPNTG
ncbi:hypothetical protein CRG98_047598 [Punica granatum]|uniref:CBS domain-containing protein n=1 Tax=Punica granatum TaxID=22663 RepID=A0A2I0HJU9_PUNGR|nr:hypothetical protein CRG98_047598 [Punica granatum]